MHNISKKKNIFSLFCYRKWLQLSSKENELWYRIDWLASCIVEKKSLIHLAAKVKRRLELNEKKKLARELQWFSEWVSLYFTLQPMWSMIILLFSCYRADLLLFLYWYVWKCLCSGWIGKIILLKWKIRRGLLQNKPERGYHYTNYKYKAYTLVCTKIFAHTILLFLSRLTFATRVAFFCYKHSHIFCMQSFFKVLLYGFLGIRSSWGFFSQKTGASYFVFH